MYELAAADPVVEHLPALVEPGDPLLLAGGHLRRGKAPEAHADRRADQPAGPDVADVLEAVEPDVAAQDDVGAARLVEQRERPAEPRRQDVVQAVGQRRDLRLALGDQLLRAGELLGRVARALGVDEDALALAEVVRQAAQARLSAPGRSSRGARSSSAPSGRRCRSSGSSAARA